MKKLAKWLTSGLAIFIFLGGLFLFAIPFMPGFKLAVVFSGSMEPAMPVGALAIMTPVEPEDIKVNDIVAYHPIYDPATIVSHRVIEVTERGSTFDFRTKGDANEEPDLYRVPASNVLGLVIFSVPYMGYGLLSAREYLQTEAGFAVLVVVPTLLIITMAAKDINSALNPRIGRLKKLRTRFANRERMRNRVDRRIKELGWGFR